MFNVSCRSKASFPEKMATLREVSEKVSSCSLCPLSEERKVALSGKFVEPSDAIIIDLMPTSVEDKFGELLAGDRDKNFAKLFGLAKPSLDITKLSFVTVFKCFGTKERSNVCLSYLNEQISAWDPILVIALGSEVLKLISGKDLELGKFYATGDSGQYLLYGLMHPREVVAEKEKKIPIWKEHLDVLAKMALKFDMKILKS